MSHYTPQSTSVCAQNTPSGPFVHTVHTHRQSGELSMCTFKRKVNESSLCETMFAHFWHITSVSAFCRCHSYLSRRSLTFSSSLRSVGKPGGWNSIVERKNSLFFAVRPPCLCTSCAVCQIYSCPQSRYGRVTSVPPHIKSPASRAEMGHSGRGGGFETAP